MAKKETKEKKVLTVEEKIDALLAEMAELKASDKAKDEKISMLTQIADKGRVENFESKLKKDTGSIVKVSTLNGVVVTSWRSVLDEVYKDSNGIWHEKQVIETTTEDGKTQSMDLVDFFRNVKKVPAKVILRGKKLVSEDPEIHTEEFKVSVEGKEYTLEGAFIN